MAFPKKLSAYMTFSNANRERVRDELIASGHDKPTIADIARAISVEWNAKTDEEKAALKEATERAYETAVAEAIARGETPDEKPPDGGRVDGGVDGGRADASDTVLPVARVKRIIKLDKEVKQASADAIKCVSKAVELFLEGLAVGSHAAMRAAKRKGVQYKDLEAFVLRRGKYEFLHDHVWAMRPREGEKGDGDDEDEDDADGGGSVKKRKEVTDANGSMRVTDFFTPGESPKKRPRAETETETETETANGGDTPTVIPETEVQPVDE